jgi:hypothetical protein
MTDLVRSRDKIRKQATEDGLKYMKVSKSIDLVTKKISREKQLKIRFEGKLYSFSYGSMRSTAFNCDFDYPSDKRTSGRYQKLTFMTEI